MVNLVNTVPYSYTYRLQLYSCTVYGATSRPAASAWDAVRER